MTNTSHHKFTIGDALSFGWDKFKQKALVTTVSLIVMWLVSFVFGVADGLLESMGGIFVPAGIAILLVSYAVSIWLGYNFIKMFLKMTRQNDNHNVNIGDLFEFKSGDEKKMFYYFLGCLLYGLVVAVGLILLIIPGIYFAIKYSFVPCLIIDKDMSITDAFRKSGEMTDGHMLQLLGAGIVSMLMVILGMLLLIVCVMLGFTAAKFVLIATLGMLLLIVGVIPATIVVYFMYTYIYMKLLGEQATN